MTPVRLRLCWPLGKSMYPKPQLPTSAHHILHAIFCPVSFRGAENILVLRCKHVADMAEIEKAGVEEQAKYGYANLYIEPEKVEVCGFQAILLLSLAPFPGGVLK